MWQQSGSPESMNFEAAGKWINDLNYAGFKDWRLPTLEEAMSLMEREQKNGVFHVDPVFNKTQGWIWTADHAGGAAAAWVVGFGGGNCGRGDPNYPRFVRAVRSGQALRNNLGIR
jgi:hypothetical protein